jgi:hypothetical protein
MGAAVTALPGRAADDAATGSHLRRFAGRALQLLERLGSPSRRPDNADLPPAFFKYPPV